MYFIRELLYSNVYAFVLQRPLYIYSLDDREENVYGVQEKRMENMDF